MIKMLALFAGISGGLFWTSLSFYLPSCVPVTEASEVFCNRLGTPALALMLLGFAGLFGLLHSALGSIAKTGLLVLLVGLSMMVLGNFNEYWIFWQLPHEGPDGLMRGLAWMTVLMGVLLVLVGSLVTGWGMVRRSSASAWLGLAFALLLPITVGAGLFSLSGIGIPLGVLSVLVGGYQLVQTRS